ncbi:MAG TPA: DUF433 domain-containing protein [Thermoanaerobaculia bacterium]|nr:DUF433 domain-containing protein [Thermoanaerobaculia bacterium]
MRYESHFDRNPEVCGGEPIIRGTRVTLRALLADLAVGRDEADILRSFPAVTKENLKAVIAFAASCAEGAIPNLERLSDADSDR